MENNKKKIAIITGASVGLGAEFAKQIEERFFVDEIWLLARRAQAMGDIARKFSKAKGVVVAIDLTNPDEILKFEEKLTLEKPNIKLLVNNAGFGKIGTFSDLKKNEQLNMIDLNVRALTDLSYICLPHMQKGAAILQVASSIAYCPAPYFAVYAATKSFVLSFSQALKFELKDREINVMAVCPGPVATEFFSVANNGRTKNPFNEFLVAQPEQVVKKALDDLEKNKGVSIFGTKINIFASFAGFIPKNLAMKVMAKRMSKHESDRL